MLSPLERSRVCPRFDRSIEGHGYATDVRLDAKTLSGLKAVVGFERAVRD